MHNQTLGNRARDYVSPESPEEVAETLRQANETGQTVIPVGGGTKQGFGGEGGEADLLLSTANLAEVIEYSPGDMTITVQAGATIQTIIDAVREHNQMVPLDPSFPAQATIGGVIAANDSGPKRMLYGSARDHVIGLHVAHSNGEILRSGGKVVKNVAGYDMNKLFIGSMGTLGVITEVTLKLRPLPKDQSMCVLTFPEGVESAVKPFITELLDTHLEPVTLEYMNPSLTNALLNKEGYSLLITFEDVQKAVQYQEKWVYDHVPVGAELTVFREEEVDDFWRTFAHFSIDDDETVVHVKMGSKNLQVLERVENCSRLQQWRDLQVFAHGGAGHGISRAYVKGEEGAVQSFVQDLRKVCEEDGGYAILTHAPLAFRKTIGVWGTKPSYFSLLEGIKKQLDPQAILNPRRFVGGI
ncbi:FAD-binding oxidoreductase [Natribacillus halophilus]|uniref:Glycolate oxidase FAD binding subunit n=1 Tax=Natribacillus halophilus TaxID=549003 RepID=A0A1G8LWM1_9BACI|nr:FAD-binding oxidoreductase [Natribacillus halophilus]SDI60058.1 glycolate oxidase FAD binding subunit [Natribacillus halophilus]